jgi:hypothetical protein
MEDAAIISDLFGNSSYRFQHVDSTLVLSVHVGGGYHLLGDIHMVSDTGIGELVNMVRPLFVIAAALLTVIIPPFCAMFMLAAVGILATLPMLGWMGILARSWMHASISEKFLKLLWWGTDELGKFWVTDSLTCVGSEPATMQAKLDALRPSLGPVGIYLTDQGRYHLFNSLAKTVLGLREGSIGKPPKPAGAAASSLISGRKYYWRVFTSDCCSTGRPSGRGNNGRGSGGGSRQRLTPFSRPDATVKSMYIHRYFSLLLLKKFKK